MTVQISIQLNGRFWADVFGSAARQDQNIRQQQIFIPPLDFRDL